MINLGKYGSFHTNHILGRPYHLTFEVLDPELRKDGEELRVVPPAEANAAALLEEAEAEDGITPSAEDEEDGALKSNVNIIDDPTVQKMTMAEIEAMKSDSNARDLISRIMQSHTALDQKTAFSLAKYTLRKHKKYMKRFCILPLDTAALTDWMMAERDFSKVMEIRNEMFGLIGSWANVHAAAEYTNNGSPSSRYLVIDDTGGLVVAAMAERLGILHQTDIEFSTQAETNGELDHQLNDEEEVQEQGRLKKNRQRYGVEGMSATSNTITMIHANQQPNLALLRYFNYDSNNPSPSHPLFAHLKTLTWLQLLEPESDPTYQEPPSATAEELATWKSSRRSNYYRKRRRWQRTKAVIDETQAGNFDGLIITSYTSPVSILRHLLPLLRGGAQVVVYSPHVEPLIELSDLYSTARRTAFLNTLEEARVVPSDNFPLDPTLLLATMVQTARVRKWQCLPGRTHPLMMGKGGAEGYLFSATRVLPAQGLITARGHPPRRGKKTDAKSEGSGVIDVESDVEIEDSESAAVKRDRDDEGEDADVFGPAHKKLNVEDEDLFDEASEATALDSGMAGS